MHVTMPSFTVISALSVACRGNKRPLASLTIHSFNQAATNILFLKKKVGSEVGNCRCESHELSGVPHPAYTQGYMQPVHKEA